MCKACKACLKSKHYKNNKQKYHASRNRQYTKTKEMIIKIKDVPCTDCSIEYPHYVMHFDHLKDKSFNISQWKRLGKSRKVIMEEIEKCEVVCANCHAERTFQRQIMGM
jgi:hypothetical protein